MFLEKRSQSLESIKKKNIFIRSKNPREIKSKSSLVNSNPSEKNYVICELPHPLIKYICNKYVGMQFSEQFAIVKRQIFVWIVFLQNIELQNMGMNASAMLAETS